MNEVEVVKFENRFCIALVVGLLIEIRFCIALVGLLTFEVNGELVK